MVPAGSFHSPSYDRVVSRFVHRARSSLVAMCLLGAAALAGGVAPASASVNAIANASNCSGSSCSNFKVSMWGSPIRPYKSGTICFKGRCQSIESNSAGLFVANFNSVGPYKNGSKTTARLSYRGRYYNRTVWISCGC